MHQKGNKRRKKGSTAGLAWLDVQTFERRAKGQLVNRPTNGPPGITNTCSHANGSILSSADDHRGIRPALLQAYFRVFPLDGRPVLDDKAPWFELLDDLEGELLSVCDDTVGVSECMAESLNFTDGAETKELAEVEEKAKLASLDNLQYIG